MRCCAELLLAPLCTPDAMVRTLQQMELGAAKPLLMYCRPLYRNAAEETPSACADCCMWQARIRRAGEGLGFSGALGGQRQRLGAGGALTAQGLHRVPQRQVVPQQERRSRLHDRLEPPRPQRAPLEERRALQRLPQPLQPVPESAGRHPASSTCCARCRTLPERRAECIRRQDLAWVQQK